MEGVSPADGRGQPITLYRLQVQGMGLTPARIDGGSPILRGDNACLNVEDFMRPPAADDAGIGSERAWGQSRFAPARHQNVRSACAFGGAHTLACIGVRVQGTRPFQAQTSLDKATRTQGQRLVLI